MSKHDLKTELSAWRGDLRREVYKREPNVFELENCQYNIRLIKEQLSSLGVEIKRGKYE